MRKIDFFGYLKNPSNNETTAKFISLDSRLRRDFLEPKILTFFVLVIKNWCLCLSLLKIVCQLRQIKYGGFINI